MRSSGSFNSPAFLFCCVPLLLRLFKWLHLHYSGIIPSIIGILFLRIFHCTRLAATCVNTQESKASIWVPVFFLFHIIFIPLIITWWFTQWHNRVTPRPSRFGCEDLLCWRSQLRCNSRLWRSPGKSPLIPFKVNKANLLACSASIIELNISFISFLISPASVSEQKNNC